MGTYWFGNVDGDTLEFDLGTQDGDTSFLFEDEVQRFRLVKSGPDTMSVFGYTDPVYTYVILHTDLGGSPMISALQGERIVIGKDLGLVRFLRVDSFPYVLQPIEMLGNLDPPLGMYRITTAMIEDHQPGDVLQFRNYQGSVLPTGQPFNYSKTTYLSRTDTPDSVIYETAWEYFNIASNALTTGSGTYGVSKNEVYAELPFEKFNGSFNVFRRSGPGSCFPTWYLYRENAPSLGICSFGNCWIGTDTQGPPPSSNNTAQLGLGVTSYFYQQPLNGGGTHYFSIRDLVYFVKNGVECGSEISVGIEASPTQTFTELHPNPTTSSVVISSSVRMERIDVLNAQGRVVLQIAPKATQVELDLTGTVPTSAPPGTHPVALQHYGPDATAPTFLLLLRQIGSP